MKNYIILDGHDIVTKRANDYDHLIDLIISGDTECDTPDCDYDVVCDEYAELIVEVDDETFYKIIKMKNNEDESLYDLIEEIF